MPRPVIVTCGEPAGIGPELAPLLLAAGIACAQEAALLEVRLGGGADRHGRKLCGAAHGLWTAQRAHRSSLRNKRRTWASGPGANDAPHR